MSYTKAALALTALIFSKPASAQEISCDTFAQYLKDNSGMSASHDDWEVLSPYFKKDLRDDSVAQLNLLDKWARDCSDYFRNAGRHLPPSDTIGENALFDRAQWTDLGISALDNIMGQKRISASQEQQANRDAINNQVNRGMIASIPNCDDGKTTNQLKSFVSNSQSHYIIGLKDFSDVSSADEMGSRVCQADALFDSGEHHIEYTVKWFDKSRNSLLFPCVY